MIAGLCFPATPGHATNASLFVSNQHYISNSSKSPKTSRTVLAERHTTVFWKHNLSWLQLLLSFAISDCFLQLSASKHNGSTIITFTPHTVLYTSALSTQRHIHRAWHSIYQQ